MFVKTYPKTASARDLQRDYRKILDTVKESKEPIFLLRNNQAEAVIIDSMTFEALVEKAHGLTEEEVLKIAREGRKAHRAGKTKEISSLADLS